MLEIYLCEDEEKQLFFLREAVCRIIEEEKIQAVVVSARKDPEETLGDAKRGGRNPALFFVDVHLQGYSINGFELVRQLQQQAGGREYYFVFLTSIKEQAYKVFEFDWKVLDYIIKYPEYFIFPEINLELKRRLLRVFEKIRELQRNTAVSSKMIVVECGTRLVEIRMDDIIFIRTNIKGRKGIEIITSNRKIITGQTLKSISEGLDEAFTFVNKSNIVKKNKVKEIDKKNRYLLLEGGYKCEIPFRELKRICSLFENGEYRR